MSTPCNNTRGYTNIMSMRQGQQSVSGLERVWRMRRIGVFLDLSRIRHASGFGETGYMHSSFVDAFVEQVFASGLGLFVHNETSPNASHVTKGLRLTFTMTHLKYSFVASISPASSNTENLIPFGCVRNTWSYLQIISRSWS